MPTDKKWKMPDWMEPYMCFLSIQFRNPEDLKMMREDVEEWHNDHTAIQTNAPRALIAMGIHGEIGMLIRIHDAGLLYMNDWKPNATP